MRLPILIRTHKSPPWICIPQGFYDGPPTGAVPIWVAGRAVVVHASRAVCPRPAWVSPVEAIPSQRGLITC
jgi:hypothetical protein